MTSPLSSSTISQWDNTSDSEGTPPANLPSSYPYSFRSRHLRYHQVKNIGVRDEHTWGSLLVLVLLLVLLLYYYYDNHKAPSILWIADIFLLGGRLDSS